jgi:ribosome biogenesis GTPase
MLPMARRKLSQQQTRRIARQRETLLDDGGASAQDATEGLIVAQYGSQVDVEPAAGGSPLRCHLRANLEGLVTGDRVLFCPGEATGIVVAGLPRHSALSRPDSRGRLKAVAANIDQVAVVIAPLPEPHANLLDRYLVAAEAIGALPLIVVNKADLLADASLARAMDDLLDVYPGLGYRVLYCTANGDVSRLAEALCGHTSVLVGQSGVGKTSLLNALLPSAAQRTGELSVGHAKGTHTTTTSMLFHLPSGGAFIDSPGIREFGLTHLTRDAVEHGFREFHPYLGRCRFRDCRHEGEPGCALLAALAEGHIGAQRLESYRHIIGSLAGE